MGFTPTFNRHLGAEKHALLDRKSAYTVPTEIGGDEQVSVVQVLVVRSCCDESDHSPVADSSEFGCYVRDYGSDYIVIEMPPTINLEAFVSGLQIRHSDVPDFKICSPLSTSDQGGIGYARLFTQLFSYFVELHHIWMVDDNVQLCYALNLRIGEDKLDNSDILITSKPAPCSFATMMLSLEKCIGAQIPAKEADADKSTEIVLGESIDKKYILDFSSLPQGRFHKFPSDSGEEGLPYHARQVKRLEALETGIFSRLDFSGTTDSYAVLGSGRDVTNYQNCVYDRPFSVTHSVYSFFLLNVSATVERGAYYPPKPFWEDIEFNQICEEKGLSVVKANFSISNQIYSPLYVHLDLLYTHN